VPVSAETPITGGHTLFQAWVMRILLYDKTVWRSISDYRVLTAADNTTVPTLADIALIQNFIKHSHLVPS
jgi:hypothetical protein